MRYCELHTVWFAGHKCPSCVEGVDPYLRGRDECSSLKEWNDLKKKGLVR